MAAFEQHLSFDISRTTSTKVLRIVDTSYYPGNVENELVEILPPTSTRWTTFYVVPTFDLKANAASLGLVRAKSYGELPDLPDGIYQIKISIKPNFSTHEEFYHLRTASIEKTWNEQLCALYSQQCSVSKGEFQSLRTTLLSIWMDIKAAIAKVEICHERKEGLQLYEKALNDLNKYKDECGCS